MAKTPGLELTTGIDPVNAVPVISSWGPYADVEEANAALTLRYIGQTVGILTGSTITEYWYQGGVEDGNLVVKTTGGGSEPTPISDFTVIGADYIQDPEVDATPEDTTYITFPISGTTDEGDEFDLGQIQFVVEHTDEGKRRYDIPVVYLDGTFEVLPGDPSTTTPTFPAAAFASNVGHRLTPIEVNPTESHKYDKEIPTSNKNPENDEVRSNSLLFAMWDSVLTRFGLTRQSFLDYLIGSVPLFEASDTITWEQGESGTNVDEEGNPLSTLLAHATVEPGGEPYVLPTASPTVKGGIKPGKGTVMNGEFLDIIANATSFIFVTPTGNDTTGQRGNSNAPFASLAAAQSVYQAGDTIQVNPGTYTGEITLELFGQTVQYYFAPGAVVGFSDQVALISDSDTHVIVRGFGDFTGNLGISNSGSFDAEFNTWTSGGTFSVDFSGIGRFKGKQLTMTSVMVLANNCVVDFFVEKITIPTHFFAQAGKVHFYNGIITSVEDLVFYHANTSYNAIYTDAWFHNCTLNVAKLRTSTGTGTNNSFRGRVVLENTVLNTTGDGIEFQKAETGSEFWFNNATINAGGTYSMRATTTGGQHGPPDIRIFGGGLILNKDVITDAGRPITNLVPGTTAYRMDAGGTPVLSIRSGIYVIDEPGASSGGATNLDGLSDVIISSPATNQVLKYNGTNWVNDTDSTGGGSGTTIQETISQTAHGFSVGSVIRYNGTAWTAAQADSSANAEVLGVVSAVPDANSFTVVYSGKITLSGLTAGSNYFLDSSSAGAYTATEPSAEGTVSKPLFFAISTTVAIVQIQRGILN